MTLTLTVFLFAKIMVSFRSDRHSAVPGPALTVSESPSCVPLFCRGGGVTTPHMQLSGLEAWGRLRGSRAAVWRAVTLPWAV